jgi:hypothetical protein
MRGRRRATTVETMVRTYRSPDAYARDAKKLARDGWTVVNTFHRQPRAGIGRIVTLGFATLLRPPSPEIVATYQRAARGAATTVTLPAIPVGGGVAPPARSGSPLRTLFFIGLLLIIAVLVLS